PPDLRSTLFPYTTLFRSPRRPAGCNAAKSSCRKLRRSRSETASASPTAIATVVLAVGARFSEHASSFTLTSSTTSLACASVDCRSEEHTSELQSPYDLVC